MSNASAFRLITNDGKQDDLLMATRFLNQRLLDIRQIRKNNPNVRDDTPTLSDLEKTHILFTNAHFKPFVAMAFEYQAKPASGNPQLGQQVEFSIPQYGDFFSDMFVHFELSEISAANENDATRYIRYVDYPGMRILKKVEMEVNGNHLDSYTSDILAFKREFCIQPNKEVSYKRCVGQQVPWKAKKESCEGRGVGYSEESMIVDGPQTPKAVQPQLTLTVPLDFWFNKDVRLSVASIAIPYGQRYVRVTLAEAEELVQHVGLTPADDNPGANPLGIPQRPQIRKCELWTNNIFVNPEVHDIYVKRIGFQLIRVHKTHTVTVDKESDRILLSQLKWPTEKLYVGFRPVENNDKNSSKMLESWHQFSRTVDRTAHTGALSAKAYWWDAAGFANDPAQADDYTAALQRSDGRATGINFAAALAVPGATVLTAAQVNQVLKANGYKLLDETAFADPLLPANAEIIAASPSNCCEATYKVSEPIIDQLGLESHGIQLYKEQKETIYNAYYPFHYGGHNHRNPEDKGKYYIPFSLYTGIYQPSGHLNISRARETFITYQSSDIRNTYTANLLIIASAINFLLISDGSAVLRYST